MGGGDKGARESISSDPLGSIAHGISGDLGDSLNGLGEKIHSDIANSQAIKNSADNLATLTNAKQRDADANFGEQQVKRLNAAAKQAEVSVANLDGLTNKAFELSIRNFDRFSRTNKLLNTPIQERDAFKQGLKAGQLNYLVGQNNRPNTGLDLSVKTQAQDDFVAFQQGIRAAARSSHDEFGDSVRRGSQVVIDNLLPDKGGFTATFEPEIDISKKGIGVTLTPYSSFLTVNLANTTFTTGDVTAYQVGTDISRGALKSQIDIDVGATTALFFDDGDFINSLNGTFSSTEVTIPIRKFPVSFEYIKTGSERPVSGIALGFNNGGPSFQQQFGVGTVDINNLNQRPLNELPSFIFHNVTGGIFSLDN